MADDFSKLFIDAFGVNPDYLGNQTLYLTVQEACKGLKKEVTMGFGRPCSACHGTGKSGWF